MTEYKDFSSLPPDKEQAFVVYEKTSVEAGKKARNIALIVAGSFLVVVMAIVFSSEPPENKMAHDDLSALAGPKTPKKEASKAEDKPADKPAEEAKAEGATGGEAAGEGAAAEGADKPEDKAEGEGAKPEGQ